MTEQLREPRYIRKRVSLSGRQPKVVELPFPVDFIAFTDVSEVDPSKVYVAFNSPYVFLPISKVIVAELPLPVVTRLFFKWESSEDNKIIEVYVAGGPSLRIGVTTVNIGGDYVGLAKESTLSSIKNALASVGTDKFLTTPDNPSNLDIALSSLRDSLKGSDNKDFSTLESDVEGIKAQTDKLQFDTDNLLKIVIDKIAGTSLTGRDWSADFEKLQNLDVALTVLRDSLLDPVLDQLILNNATINSAGESDLFNIRGAKHVDVLIYVGTPTGNPNITFHLQVVEPTSGKVIRTYDGTQLTGEGADYITVDGGTLGTHVKVTWDGSLDSSNYFDGCFVRIVAKR